MWEGIASHICSFFSIPPSPPPVGFFFPFIFLYVKSKGGCHGRQLACLVHMIEAGRDLQAGSVGPPPMPFAAANEDGGSQVGLLCQEEAGNHYKSTLSIVL